jgi:hypothetical protein
LKENKKLKAAIIGVIHYLQETANENNNNKTNRWVHLGRELIMRNRYLVQRRDFRK